MINLPTGRLGQALALGLLVCLILVVYLAVVDPLVQAYADGERGLAERAELAARLEQTIARVPALEAERARLREGKEAAEALLPGATDAIALATLQARLKELATKGGARIGSIETLPTEPRGEFRRVGVRLAMQSDLAGLATVLKAIETMSPPVFVDNVQIRSNTTKPSVGAGPVALSIALDVQGFKAP